MKKKIGLILLAAGNSVRYEGIKLLDTIGGKQMYLHIVDKIKTLPLEPKIIVTQYDEIAQKSINEGFQVIINDRPEDGISRSIRLGMEEILSIDPSLDAIMFSVCDQPYIKRETIEAVIDAFQTQEKQLISVAHGEKLGNPCIFGRKYFAQLSDLSGDTGGKSVLRKNMEDVFLLHVDNPEELVDIDTRLPKNIF